MSWISDSVISNHHQRGHDAPQDVIVVGAWRRFGPFGRVMHRGKGPPQPKSKAGLFASTQRLQTPILDGALARRCSLSNMTLKAASPRFGGWIRKGLRKLLSISHQGRS